MKKQLLMLLLLAGSLTFAADVFDGRSWNEANKISTENQKPILIKFDAKWCPNCRQMDRVTFSDENIIRQLDEFIPVKIDIDTKAGISLAHDYQVTAIPTIVVLGEDGEVAYQQAGYQDPGAFAETLKNVLYTLKATAAVPQKQQIPLK
ncbi:MAG: thioredoxin family protein [FCB group bacterium]|nr:thioredoxin family protein [FCB group bacterium]